MVDDFIRVMLGIQSNVNFLIRADWCYCLFKSKLPPNISINKGSFFKPKAFNYLSDGAVLYSNLGKWLHLSYSSSIQWFKDIVFECLLIEKELSKWLSSLKISFSVELSQILHQVKGWNSALLHHTQLEEMNREIETHSFPKMPLLRSDCGWETS